MAGANPRVTDVVAVTRQGSGGINQDRYLVGPNYAAVFDGASSDEQPDPLRDGGWYADALAQRLAVLLARQPGSSTADLVAEAVTDVRDTFSLDAASAPTSTVAIARWTNAHVDTYLLGDSTIVALHLNGTEELHTDSRLTVVGRTHQDAYRRRLAAGHGFDATHQQLLRRLRHEQRRKRNRSPGYWIAGADPSAAYHARCAQLQRSHLAGLILATDGASAGVNYYGSLPGWRQVAQRLAGSDPGKVLSAIEHDEQADPHAQRWPRSKASDDKTLVYVNLV